MIIGHSETVILATALTKVFAEEQFKVAVLNDINLEIRAGEMAAIVGPSGSGKSTLLHILGGLDSPTSGRIEIGKVNIHQLSEQEQSRWRNQYLGFVYQFHHLLPEFSALENVAMPLLIGKVKPAVATLRAREMLMAVGLGEREQHRIGELSGGERQRVAIARALVTNPKCVLADEPTGNLDHKTALQIYDLIFSLKKQFNTAVVVVTHDLAIAERMGRVLTLEDGRLINSSCFPQQNE